MAADRRHRARHAEVDGRATRSPGCKVAPFYGCHIIRPESVNGWESSRNPHSLEDIITALGGEAVDYAGKTRCCGFHVQLEKDGIAADDGRPEHAHGQGRRAPKPSSRRARCATSRSTATRPTPPRAGDAPTCRRSISRSWSRLALGIDPSLLGLNKHIVSPGMLLQSHDLAPAHVA